jgi:Recombination endonuclease VII
MKLCRRCGIQKRLDEFGQNKSRQDGKAEYCRECFRQINLASYRKRQAAKGLTVREEHAAPPGMRWCPDCQDFKPEEQFPRNRSTPTGLAGYCKPHQNDRVTESRNRVHGGSRLYHLNHRYGIGDDEVDAMIEAQAQLCPICRRPLGAKPHVDHDHGTGEVRGLLCFTCNVGLGNFGDDAERLERAAIYLRGSLTAPSRIAPGVYEVAGTTWRRQDSTAAAG